eukprot:CAMPEP_0185902054 /NCGR_PEP_ID=MMETSP0196C-20130402/1349_1 /TAXON_ID=2932 /ORGANISM="Alexandrium fundyense, Strain CCMP1719" /LENGTH=42 /DNA_ID= /DNA_START= /DNA_END= /DNA_ORIENTATION=
MTSVPISMTKLMGDGGMPASDVVRESFKAELKEAAMMDFIPK